MALKVGVSSCLLGEPVRYNGDHKRHEWIADVLASEVTLVGFCPESAMGLGTPRPAMRLVDSKGVTLQTVNSGEDLTASALETSERLARKAVGLDGFILKKNSPSCGLERVKVYSSKGMPIRQGQGFFAAELRRAHPLLPLIEEGRLSDPEQRENFVLRIHAYSRLRKVKPIMREIQAFHRSHKLVLMEHSQRLYRELGRLVGNPEKVRPTALWERYSQGFMSALEHLPSVRSRTNVLQHAAGYLRDRASDEERTELADSIIDFRKGALPFIAPLTLLQSAVRRHKIEYLQDQLFFSPYPRRLGAHGRL